MTVEKLIEQLQPFVGRECAVYVPDYSVQGKPRFGLVDQVLIDHIDPKSGLRIRHAEHPRSVVCVTLMPEGSVYAQNKSDLKSGPTER